MTIGLRGISLLATALIIIGFVFILMSINSPRQIIEEPIQISEPVQYEPTQPNSIMYNKSFTPIETLANTIYTLVLLTIIIGMIIAVLPLFKRSSYV